MVKLHEKYTEADLLELIHEAEEEGQQIDYKESRALFPQNESREEKIEKDWKANLCKDVSAMANANGGVIIYGITERDYSDKTKKRVRPEDIDEGIDPNERTVETLASILNDHIQRPFSYEIDKVELKTKYPDSGRIAYVIRIPQSNSGPHQVTYKGENRYYIRRETENKSMQDWEIRDIFARSTKPKLQLIIEPWKGTNFIERRNNKVPPQFPVGIEIINLNPTPAEYAIVTIWVDERFDIFTTPSPDTGLKHPHLSESHSFELPHSKDVIKAKRYIISRLFAPPIFGSNPQTVYTTQQVQVNKKAYQVTGLKAYIKWQVEYPGMPTQIGIEAFTLGDSLVDTYMGVRIDLTHSTLFCGNAPT